MGVADGTLARLARRGPPAPAGERCELCATPIGDDHGHVADIRARSILCACAPCHLLFSPEGAGHDRHRSIPDRVVDVGSAPGSTPVWERLDIPVGVAFFFHHSGLDRIVVQYPGPGGATESELTVDAWSEVVEAAPDLATMRPDVEALLVRAGPEPAAFVVPIDRCYRLTGRLRLLWEGLDGGVEVRAALDDTFADLAAQARGRGDR